MGCWIAITNVALTVIVQQVTAAKRGFDLSENYKSTTFYIFIAMYINTSVIILLAMCSFVYPAKIRQENSKANILVGPYDEFSSEWYLRIGVAICFA